jgi:hypothetical protein
MVSYVDAIRRLSIDFEMKWCWPSDGLPSIPTIDTPTIDASTIDASTIGTTVVAAMSHYCTTGADAPCSIYAAGTHDSTGLGGAECEESSK